MPAAVKEYLARQYMNQGKRILDCLYAFSGREHVRVDTIYPPSHGQGSDGGGGGVITSPGGTISDYEVERGPHTGAGEGDQGADMKEEFLLQYDSLSEEDRIAILVEVMNGHQENNLSSGDLDRLRSLPLFTSYPDKHPTSVAEYEKVFWHPFC